MNKTGEFYVVVEAVRGWSSMAISPIRSIKGVSLFKNKPNKLLKDQIAVKVKIEVPEEAFEPYSPTATLVVTAPLLTTPHVEVIGTGRGDAETAEKLRELLENT